MSEGKMNYERERAQREYEQRVRAHATALHGREQERFLKLYILAGGLMVMRGMDVVPALTMAEELERLCLDACKEPTP